MTEQLTPQLSEAEIKEYEEKCESLAKAHNVSKVHAAVIIQPGSLERHVCYIKEPNFPTKLNILNKMVSVGVYPAANELREACVIKEASSPLTYGEAPECDPYKIGVVNFCIPLIEAYSVASDKKK